MSLCTGAFVRLDVAASVARRLVMPLYRSGGQAQYVDSPIAPDPGGLGSLLDWGRANLDQGIRSTTSSGGQR